MGCVSKVTLWLSRSIPQRPHSRLRPRGQVTEKHRGLQRARIVLFLLCPTRHLASSLGFREYSLGKIPVAVGISYENLSLVRGHTYSNGVARRWLGWWVRPPNAVRRCNRVFLSAEQDGAASRSCPVDRKSWIPIRDKTAAAEACGTG